MKLYTEQQVKEAIELAREKYPKDIILTTKGVLTQFTPITLPSDEEISSEAWDYQVMSGEGDDRFIHFKEGAKWMREQIQGGNK